MLCVRRSCVMLPESRAVLHELEQQAIWRMQRWRVASLLYHWHSHTLSCKAGRQTLQTLQVRNQRRRRVQGHDATLRCKICQHSTLNCTLFAMCAAQGQLSATGKLNSLRCPDFVLFSLQSCLLLLPQVSCVTAAGKSAW